MNEELQDLWTAAVLKSAELPPIRAGHFESIFRGLQKRNRSWVVPSGLIATAGTVAVVAVLLHPTPSVAAPTLNQVDQAVSAVKTFTITHAVVMEGSELYNITLARDGERWMTSYGPPHKTPYGEIIMDGKRTTSIRRFRGRIQVLVDVPSKFPQQLRELPTPNNFSSTPSEIFHSEPGKITIRRGIQWNGRVVDEFESVGAGKAQQALHHILYADATTHLPIMLKLGLPDSKQNFGETYTYDYAPIPESLFVPKIPAGAKVTDVQQDRRAVHSALGRDGLVIVDDNVTAGVFLPDTPEIIRAAKANKVRVKIEGGSPSYTWPQPVSIFAAGTPDPSTTWRQEVIYVQAPVAKLDSLRKKKRVTVLVNGHPFTMPVRRIADTQIEFQFAGHRM